MGYGAYGAYRSYGSYRPYKVYGFYTKNIISIWAMITLTNMPRGYTEA